MNTTQRKFTPGDPVRIVGHPKHNLKYGTYLAASYYRTAKVRLDGMKEGEYVAIMEGDLRVVAG